MRVKVKVAGSRIGIGSRHMYSASVHPCSYVCHAGCRMRVHAHV